MGVFGFDVVKVAGVGADVVGDCGERLVELAGRVVVALHEVVEGHLRVACPAAADGVHDTLQTGQLALDFVIGGVNAAGGGHHDVGFSLEKLGHCSPLLELVVCVSESECGLEKYPPKKPEGLSHLYWTALPADRFPK